MHRNLLLVSLLFAGCAGSATPSGFSKGDHWSMPLVGALENGHLLVPASVAGHGPYLFVIDPDAPVSTVDQQVAQDAKLDPANGPALVDENGEAQQRSFTALHELKLGDLSIDARTVMEVPNDFLNLDGRRVHGVIGRDIIADRLVFGFDRDQGIVTLAVASVFTPPPGATSVTYAPVDIDTGSSSAGGVVDKAPAGAAGAANQSGSPLAGQITHDNGPKVKSDPVLRRVVSAKVGNADVKMHLDFGAPFSELRQDLWAKAGLTAAPVDGGVRLVDEAGTVRMLDSAAPADASAAGLKSHVSVVPYVDKRFGLKKLDGVLGLDFFRGYAVYANWSASTIMAKPRGDLAATVKARLGRWGAELASCAHPGCAEVKLTQTDGGLKLDVVRDPEAKGKPLELFIGVTPAAGKTAANLLAELPAGTDTITGGVPAEYDGATLAVLDASAFLRPCQGDGGCVYPAPSH
ncbi:MAG TPA: aspartyl protease family protein [Kofleriaceae bacterium]|nr:aspartyl protease family protein [Kofleriaceae bacterium]